MSDQPKIDFKFQPINPQVNSENIENTQPNFTQKKIVGKITEQIGTGEDAKHSIVWTTIRWSFIIPSVLTLLMLIFMGFAYSNTNNQEIENLRKYILTIWAIFTPLITLSLGYAFGKDIKN